MQPSAHRGAPDQLRDRHNLSTIPSLPSSLHISWPLSCHSFWLHTFPCQGSSIWTGVMHNTPKRHTLAPRLWPDSTMQPTTAHDGSAMVARRSPLVLHISGRRAAWRTPRLSRLGVRLLVREAWCQTTWQRLQHRPAATKRRGSSAAIQACGGHDRATPHTVLIG